MTDKEIEKLKKSFMQVIWYEHGLALGVSNEKAEELFNKILQKFKEPKPIEPKLIEICDDCDKASSNLVNNPDVGVRVDFFQCPECYQNWKDSFE